MQKFKPVTTILRQLWRQLQNQLGDQLVDRLWDQLGDQLWGQLRGRLRYQQLPSQEKLDKAYLKLEQSLKK